MKINLSKNDLKRMMREAVRDALHSIELERQSFQEEVYLTIDEAASFVHLTKGTVYTKTSKGEIPHHKIGKKLYFKKSELIEWIESYRYGE